METLMKEIVMVAQMEMVTQALLTVRSMAMETLEMETDLVAEIPILEMLMV